MMFSSSRITKLLSSLNTEELNELSTWFNTSMKAIKQNKAIDCLITDLLKEKGSKTRTLIKKVSKRASNFSFETFEQHVINRIPASLHCNYEKDRSSLLRDLHYAHWYCMRDIYCEAAILLLKCREVAIMRGFHVEMLLVEMLLQRIPLEHLSKCNSAQIDL